ncbi:hypothetical protein cand_038750 [Cryptosporidium andersoni]|uniref:Uncharacterized protein n=1 Tax=Cryptosporidium andersoni TaxID=117008 RepID=A0A1J4MBP1_9CRYT|nr:hypothetical protein cand_038750 [Cryptosporidium andersoni]
MEKSSIHPLKKKLQRILNLKFDENEEFLNILHYLEEIENSSNSISKDLLCELLSSEQVKWRSTCNIIDKYRLMQIKECMESLKPLIDNTRSLNIKLDGIEKLFRDTIIKSTTSWHEIIYPLLSEFKNIEDDIEKITIKQNICNSLLSRLSSSISGNIKNIKLQMQSKEDILHSLYTIYKKCLVSESNSRKLINIFKEYLSNDISMEKLVNNKNEDNILNKSNIPISISPAILSQALINLNKMILDIESNRFQLVDEIVKIVIDYIELIPINTNIKKGTDKYDDNINDLFEEDIFSKIMELLYLYHKDSHNLILINIQNLRSKLLDYRFNVILRHGITNIDSDYDINIIDYLSSLFEWIDICGINIEVEFLIRCLHYKYDDTCTFEYKRKSMIEIQDINNDNMNKSETLLAYNILDNITSVLCIPFSNSIRGILRQFHHKQRSGSITFNVGSLTSLKLGITIVLKIAQLIDYYILIFKPLYKLVPNFANLNTIIQFPHFIQRLCDVKDEAIAQFYVYSSIIREYLSNNLSSLITNDCTISIIVLEWCTLLNDILSILADDSLLKKSQERTKVPNFCHISDIKIQEDSEPMKFNETISSMIDSFINPMFNAICTATTTYKSISTCLIRINNIAKCQLLMKNYEQQLSFIKMYIDISNQLIMQEMEQLVKFSMEEFMDRYRFKELFEELSSQPDSNIYNSNNFNSTEEPLLILSQVILDNFYDTILRFGIIPFPNIDKILDNSIKSKINMELLLNITKQYEHLYKKISSIWPSRTDILRYNVQEIEDLLHI